MAALTTIERNLILTAARVGPENIDDIVSVHKLSPDVAQRTLARGLTKLKQYERVNITEMARRLECSRNWIEPRLAAFSQLRASSDLSGRMTTVYEPVVELRLRQVRKGRPDASWLSMYGLAKLLGCDRDWVIARIGPYKNLCLKRQCKRKAVPVYPPEVADALRLEKEEVPLAGSWLTLLELAYRTGRSRKWLKYQLEVVLNIRPQPRKMHNNRIVDHYPPESELALQRIITGLKPAGNWLTTPQVAARCDIAFGTAANRLNKLKLENSEINPEQRITHKTHQLTLHWPPRVIELISECPHQPRYCRCTAA